MVKLKRFSKRVSAIMLSAFMTIGTFFSVLTPAITVNAATPTGSVSTGQIRITCVDSSVYGADRTDNNIQTSMRANIVNIGGYWDSSLSNYNFLYTPEGLGTFGTRSIEVYDMTGETPNRTNYYEDSQLDGNCVGYIVMQNGSITLSSTTVLQDSGNKTLGDFDGKRLVFVETENGAYSLNGYYPNTESTNSSNKGWQAIIDYDSSAAGIDISYDSNVASRASQSEPLHNEVYRGGFGFYVYDKEIESEEGIQMVCRPELPQQYERIEGKQGCKVLRKVRILHRFG